jgi:selenide,water dikinase
MMRKDPLSVLASSSGGCAAKIGPGQLANILARVDFHNAGANGTIIRREDVGVLRLGSSYLVQSVDMIAPITDDPYVFGAIAAAHALSDIYAKSADPVSGLITLALPSAIVSEVVASTIVQGVADKLVNAGATVLGGHTLESRDLFVGVSVTGTTDRIIPNGPAEVGDVLILTKPLGVGLIATALRLSNSGENIAAFSKTLQLSSEQVMLGTNAGVANALRATRVHASTDVSGFGLIGHLLEMAPSHRVTIKSESVPVIPGVHELVKEGVSSAGGERNWAEWAERCSFRSEHTRILSQILFDPQTSGGLLISATPESAGRLLSEFHELGADASIIGTVDGLESEAVIEIV